MTAPYLRIPNPIIQVIVRREKKVYVVCALLNSNESGLFRTLMRWRDYELETDLSIVAIWYGNGLCHGFLHSIEC